jgi:CspA family cold shock protein
MTEPQYQQGSIKWFSHDKGYGFIRSNDGNGDVFLHAKELERAGITRKLTEGLKVSYKPDRGPKGAFATDVSLVER